MKYKNYVAGCFPAEGEKYHGIEPMTVQVQNSDYVNMIARITYEDGHTKDIDIGCDSGIAVVYDIARSLVYS